MRSDFKLENRRFERISIKLDVNIPSLFMQDNIKIDNIDQEIKITNLSKTGVGFECKSELPVGYYFNVRIDVSEGKYFYGVLKIIRCEKQNEFYSHGAEFVGLADILSKVIYEQ